MKHSVAVLLLAFATAAVAADSPEARRSVTAAGYAFRPDPQDYYPSASRNLEEEGVPKVKLCYDERGRPVDVTLEESSGFLRLDEAAVRYGNAVRIKPGTIDGQAQPGCVTVPVRFSLRRSSEQQERGRTELPPVQVPPVLIDIPPPRPPPPIQLMPIPLAPSPPADSTLL